MENVKKIIENIVIKYRMVFGEKQDPKKIFKVAMSTDAKPELLKDIKKAMLMITEIVDDVNNWYDEKLKTEFEKRGLKEVKQKRKKTLVFPKLENVVENKVITAYPPEPSKYPHIGHAYASYINYLFAKKNKGKFYIRFEDTNPSLAKKEYYDAQLDGYNWLGIVADKVFYASDYMQLFYEKAKILIEKNKAYVCSCDGETIKQNRWDKKECDCRFRSKEENLKLWEKMLNKDFKQGEASLRLKLDMTSKKAEFRDPIIMRLNYNKHVRTGEKFVVWPAYVFQSAILDGYTKITHRFRSKEFEVLKPIQKIIAKELDLKYPITFEYARVNLTGVKSSGREIRKMVESGTIDWSHPALTTLIALKRRGFLPEAIKEFVDKMGISKTESTVQWSVLESINRKLLAKQDILKIASFEMPLKVKISDESGLIEDFKGFEGYIDTNTDNKEYRIRHHFNVIVKNNKLNVSGIKPKKGLNILVFAKDIMQIKILMPFFEKENAEKQLFIDKSLFKTLKEGQMVFLEGFGFCRFENKKEKIFVFTHK